MRSRILAGLFLGACLLAGCGGSDCHTYCSKYQECVSSSTDVDTCTSDCESRNTNNTDHQNRAKACADCVSGKTCADAESGCSSLCLFL